MNQEQKVVIYGWLRQWNDFDLVELTHMLGAETKRRIEERNNKRIQWITSHIRQYKHCTVNHEVVGETVVVAVQWYGHIAIAKAAPVKGDVFDLDTGIAVAFAKAMGESIPDYI